jgi:hypothetical protein
MIERRTPRDIDRAAWAIAFRHAGEDGKIAIEKQRDNLV